MVTVADTEGSPVLPSQCGSVQSPARPGPRRRRSHEPLWCVVAANHLEPAQDDTARLHVHVFVDYSYPC